jgi:hypothetical protein
MATPRLSQLQKRILQWLAADHQRTKGVILSSHEEWVKALGGYKGNVSRCLQTLETRGWIIIGRSPGGNAHHLRLTLEGQGRPQNCQKVLLKRLLPNKQSVVQSAALCFVLLSSEEDGQLHSPNL